MEAARENLKEENLKKQENLGKQEKQENLENTNVIIFLKTT